MSKWFEILKEDWKKRLKRIQEANKKRVGGKPHGARRMERSRDSKVRCDMCSKKFAPYQEMTLDNQLRYCKRCAKSRGKL